MANSDIRERIQKYKGTVKNWQIADYLGIADTTFSRWLRKELATEKKELIMSAIERLAKGECR